MGLRDMLKKKDGLNEGASGRHAETLDRLNAGPEFTFIRSDTHTQEIIQPPSHPAGEGSSSRLAAGKEPNLARRSLDVFRSGGSRSRSNSASKGSDDVRHSLQQPAADPASSRRLSQRLHLSRSPASSDYVPQNLPAINVVAASGDVESESQWENRATILAQANEERRKSPEEQHQQQRDGGAPSPQAPPGSKPGTISKATDDELQEAIRLHEEGELEQSTAAFGRLANPNGANNPLSQVLYGLALRHGWGCEPNPERAVSYLSAAASNAATVENLALQAGMKKGGAAKGELVLAIFELANCFRHGWGIPRDPVAAKQYYETAANLGDSDAMNEVAWCYLEGFGCKKDKYAAARYYRLAEENGNKTLGNSWIWKDKYAPENAGKKK
ncbi:uncharacterized protein B0I36DRAFT_362746 [Microdochium trichocladiopsis]|uniref:HCP-like protein n=1 Tax=Microdochium trichocladiopsis TaxID=1682393 RepID=A0A9P8Y6P3_9PEZI|nr:uncharacterized protein B0I36DRAFT_362746 [Microdochium trichocladiopsis]KAH7030957.1 hypothetical protein B0I36DRAFT_362746 [Microdochium trichocladiopsis]